MTLLLEGVLAVAGGALVFSGSRLVLWGAWQLLSAPFRGDR